MAQAHSGCPGPCRPAPRRGFARVAPALLAAPALLGCSGASRDVVPGSRDVIVDAGGASAASPEAYEYVARRPLGVVALAESRGLSPDDAHAAVDRLADALDACLTERGRAGALAQGAARVVAQIGADGRVGAANLRVDPGAGVAQAAVLCLLAPARLLTFPLADADARGFAIEALWGRLVSTGP